MKVAHKRKSCTSSPDLLVGPRLPILCADHKDRSFGDENDANSAHVRPHKGWFPVSRIFYVRKIYVCK